MTRSASSSAVKGTFFARGGGWDDDPELLRSDYLRLMQRALFGRLGLKPTADDKRRFRATGLSETAAALGWAERVLDIHETEVHHLLADFELPL